MSRGGIDRVEATISAAFRSLEARGRIDGVRKLPEGIVLEGAGDCVFDATRKLFWLGYGQRSDAQAKRPVEEMFAREVTVDQGAVWSLAAGRVTFRRSGFAGVVIARR
jgi:N-dimethylarginine dimethylaminohydrolase